MERVKKTNEEKREIKEKKKKEGEEEKIFVSFEDCIKFVYPLSISKKKNVLVRFEEYFPLDKSFVRWDYHRNIYIVDAFLWKRIHPSSIR